MTTHRFSLEVEVDDDHENADDAEWWADAAAGAIAEYGGTATYYLGDAEPSIVEVRGGVAEVSSGDAIVVDWDNIGEDVDAGQQALDALSEVNGATATRIRDFIAEVWPDELHHTGRHELEAEAEEAARADGA